MTTSTSPHDDGIGWDIFIRMELLTPLLKALDKCSTDAQIIKLGRDLCNALIVCKSKGIIRRDIKPQNIFLSGTGDFKLGEFDIAKTIEQTMGGTKIGTFSYMALEAYNHQPYGSSADLYSLGLIMCWLLNDRRLPFLPPPPKMPTFEENEVARMRRFSGYPMPEPTDVITAAPIEDPTEAPTEPPTGIVDISAGGWGSYALSADGTIYTNGRNHHGQRNIDHWTDVVDISAGDCYVVGW